MNFIRRNVPRGLVPALPLNTVRCTCVAVLTAMAFTFFATAMAIAASNVCDEAALKAADRTGVPLNILRAVTLTETGSRRNSQFTSWPWTVNTAGTGRWFEGRDPAVAFARDHIAGGKRNIDIGCFQLNYRWHGGAFHSIEEMFDPDRNALYAAEFLNRLHQEFGDWTRAVGAFHSRTPKYANRYLKRFGEILANLQPRIQSPAQAVAPTTDGPIPARQKNSASLFHVFAQLPDQPANSGSSLWRDRR